MKSAYDILDEIRDDLRLPIDTNYQALPVHIRRMKAAFVHLRHCNRGAYDNLCKYGDEDCPALHEWKWLLDLAKEEYRRRYGDDY